MLRNLLFLLLLLMAAAGAGWMAEHPGQLIMEWFGYRLETSAAFLLLLVCAVSVLIWGMLKLLLLLVTAPRRLGRARHHLQQERGLQAITDAFVALGDQDVAGASKYIAQAEKFLPDPTLPRLLNLQLARQQGNEVSLKQQFQALQDSPQTRPLALRGLIEEARRDGRMTDALTWGEELLALRPKHVPTMMLAVDIFSYHRRWQEALQIISNAQKRLVLKGSEARRISALIYAEQAGAMLAEQNYASAQEMLKEALRKDAGITHAALQLAGMYLQHDKLSDAATVLRRAYAATPHPALAAMLWEKVFVALPPEKRLKKLQDALKSAANQWETHLALGQYAMAASVWDQARHHLQAALGQCETTTLCKRMAELEQKHGQDTGKADYWRNRATAAQPDALWRCRSCGHQPEQWHAHCPECNRFDSIHWQLPQYAVYRLG